MPLADSASHCAVRTTSMDPPASIAPTSPLLSDDQRTHRPSSLHVTVDPNIPVNPFDTNSLGHVFANDHSFFGFGQPTGLAGSTDGEGGSAVVCDALYTSEDITGSVAPASIHTGIQSAPVSQQHLPAGATDVSGELDRHVLAPDSSFLSLFSLSPVDTRTGIDALQPAGTSNADISLPLAEVPCIDNGLSTGFTSDSRPGPSVNFRPPATCVRSSDGFDPCGQQWANPSLSSKPAQIEEIASWGDVSFLLSLFVQFQYALVPLCHRPSFASDILTRRDQMDEPFRAFVISMGK